MRIRDKCSVNVQNFLFSFCPEAGHFENFAEEVFYKVSFSEPTLFTVSNEGIGTNGVIYKVGQCYYQQKLRSGNNVFRHQQTPAHRSRFQDHRE